MERGSPYHGWTNDETWIVATQIENNEAMHDLVMAEAMLAFTDATTKAKTSAEIMHMARSHLADVLSQRQKILIERLNDILTRSRISKDVRLDGDIAIALLRALNMVRINWIEIADHYLSEMR